MSEHEFKRPGFSPGKEPADFSTLEAAMHEELRQLPPVHAPATLAPRVLARIKSQAARPWWQRPWLDWPRAWQGASIALTALVFGFGAWAQPLAWEQAHQISGVQSVADGFEAIASLRSTAWTVFSASPWTGVAALLGVAGLYLLCIGLGTACLRVASHKS